MELDVIPAEDFESLVGQSLAVRAAAGVQAMQLEKVWRSPYPTSRKLPGFSLFLRGDAANGLGQGLVVLGHPQHGDLTLMLTPVGREGASLRYEIVFN